MPDSYFSAEAIAAVAISTPVEFIRKNDPEALMCFRASDLRQLVLEAEAVAMTEMADRRGDKEAMKELLAFSLHGKSVLLDNPGDPDVK